MAGYQDLFTDPMAAIGYGLLTSRQNPLGEAAKLLQAAEQAKQQRKLEEEDREYKRELLRMKSMQPKLQFNPVTGEMFDMRTGTPFSPGGAPATDGGIPALEPLDFGGGEPAQIPPELRGNPKATQAYLQKVAEQKAKSPTQGMAEAKLESGVGKIESLSDILAKTRERVQKSNFSTGAIGAVMQEIPGTEAHDIRNSIDTIKANIGFDRLQEMRDSSKTGGALGNVSDNENKMLQKTVASLEQSQTKKQFIENLDRVKAQYKASTERLKKAYIQDYGTLEGFNFGDADTAAPQTPDFNGFKILGVE